MPLISAEAGRSQLSLRPAWSTKQVPAARGQENTEKLCLETKQKNERNSSWCSLKIIYPIHWTHALLWFLLYLQNEVWNRVSSLNSFSSSNFWGCNRNWSHIPLTPFSITGERTARETGGELAANLLSFLSCTCLEGMTFVRCWLWEEKGEINLLPNSTTDNVIGQCSMTSLASEYRFL